MKIKKERGALILALIAGLSVNGSFSSLFSSYVPFSIFPLIALALSVYALGLRYRDDTMAQGMPKMAVAWFVLGVLLYSTFIRVEYPDIGSNLLPSILSVILFFWIVVKTRAVKHSRSE